MSYGCAHCANRTRHPLGSPCSEINCVDGRELLPEGVWRGRMLDRLDATPWYFAAARERMLRRLSFATWEDEVAASG